MISARKAADALDAWAPDASGRLQWNRSIIERCPGFVLDVAEPYSAVLVAREEHWELLLTTARGEARPYLGPLDDQPEVIFDALLYALYARAQFELNYRNRAASAALGMVLRELARNAHDARYGGRAAMLLGQHSDKEQRSTEAASLFQEAITLFTEAKDVTAADTARETLHALSAPSVLSASSDA